MNAVLQTGAPYALVKAIYSSTNVRNDAIPEKLSETPRSKGAHYGRVILRKTKDSWFALACSAGGWKRYDRWVAFDAEGKSIGGCSYADIRKHFGKGPSEYYELHVVGETWRTEKPEAPDPRIYTEYEVIDFANRVFLPAIRKKFQPFVDSVYDVIRILPKDYNQYGQQKTGHMDVPARVAALRLAERMEELLEKGYNRKTTESWLASKDALSYGWGCVPANDRAFKSCIMQPNARVTYGKILMSQAKAIQQSYEEMVNTIAENKVAAESEKVDFSIEELYNIA